MSGPGRRRILAVLHTGTGQIGSASLPALLLRNQELLRAGGYLFAQGGGPGEGHRPLAPLIRPGADPDRQFRTLVTAQLEASGARTLLLCDDGLFGASDASLARLRRLLGDVATELRVVVHLRAQDQHFELRYQQLVKAGETGRLRDRIGRADLSRTYDYWRRLHAWQAALRPAELAVRTIQADAGAESLWHSFLDAAHLDIDPDRLQRPPFREHPLDAASVEFLRILNLLRTADPTAGEQLPPNRTLSRRLAEAASGPTLRLEHPVRDLFMAQWEESNRRVQREFLPAVDRPLFAPPAAAVSEQRLEPRRLDDLLAVTELPQDVHGPLRMLVDREAVRDRVSSRARPGADRAEQLVLHIGTSKTGTSYLQSFFAANRGHLAEVGFCYPQSPGQVRHHRLGLYAMSEPERIGFTVWHRERESDHAAFERDFRSRLHWELAMSGLPRVLMSDEILYDCTDRALRRLRGLIDSIAVECRLVVYLRRQDDHLISRYQQDVKTGEVRRLSEWATQDRTERYDYAARLRRIEELLQPVQVVARRFEPNAFTGNSLHADFLDAAGISLDAGALVVGERRNEGLDADQVEFLRLLNLHRTRNEGALPGRIDNTEVVRRLTAAPRKATLTLPEGLLDEFMSRWARSNREVARDRLGAENGELFREPRKQTPTTAVQRLDRETLELLLGITDLSQQVCEAMRSIAQREAAAG